MFLQYYPNEDQLTAMKTTFLIFFLFFITYSFCQDTDSIPFVSSYYESDNVDIGYYGFKGNTMDITLSKKKVCMTCYRLHSKFFGGGFEIGRTIKYELVGGPKVFYQRGQHFGSFRIGLSMLTNFDDWIVLLRPEYMVHFFKDQSLSLGLAFNFSYVIKGPEKLYFGILAFGARYYFEYDKRISR